MSSSAYATKKRGRVEAEAEDTREKAVSPPPIKRRQQQSSTTQKAVANFFKPASQKETVVDKVSWDILHDTVLRAVHRPSGTTTSDLPPKLKRRKIAAFDFDSTLIVPSSGLKHSRDHNDWKWWHPSVPATLKRLHEEQYILAILTNQGGITLPSEAASKSKTAKSDGKRYQDFKRKATAALTQLDLPIRLYGATERDIYRKPRIGMWRQLLHDLKEEHGIDSNDIDLDSCLFVGDAAGRIAGSTTNGTKINKDFSCSDRDIAANIGIPFQTPEEYFLDEVARPFERSFDPKAYLALLPETPPIIYTRKNPQDIILSCGCPGAGKSSFYWRHLQPVGYERVNQDILKSRDRCVEVATAHLKEGRSVSVDNTNADPPVRAVWIKLAKSFNIPIRCVYFTAPARLCEHNDAVRALNADIETLNREKRTILPAIAFHGFVKRHLPPQVDEGFEDITQVNFTVRTEPSVNLDFC